jgi:hypothetical protein
MSNSPRVGYYYLPFGEQSIRHTRFILHRRTRNIKPEHHPPAQKLLVNRFDERWIFWSIVERGEMHASYHAISRALLHVWVEWQDE